MHAKSWAMNPMLRGCMMICCVTCSDATSILINTGRRSAQMVFAHEEEPVNEAEFVLREDAPYFRITVTDAHGKRANTRVYSQRICCNRR